MQDSKRGLVNAIMFNAIKNMFVEPTAKATVPAVMNDDVLTMSSREIAELCKKEHRNVARDIRNMLDDLGQGVLSFEHTYINQQNGQEYVEYLLPKDLTITLVAGYNVRLRHAIIKRWQELEQNAITRTPTLLDSSTTSCAAFCCV